MFWCIKHWILIFKILLKWKDTLNVKLKPPAGGSKSLLTSESLWLNRIIVIEPNHCDWTESLWLNRVIVTEPSHCDWTESFKRLIHSGTNHCHVAQRHKTVLGIIFCWWNGGKTVNMVSKTWFLILTYCLLNCCIKSISQSYLFLSKKRHSCVIVTILKYIHFLLPYLDFYDHS